MKKKLKRITKETKVSLYIGEKYKIDTGICFFNHMLEQLTLNSSINFVIKSVGDINVDIHHTIEDTGIVIGKLLKKMRNLAKERYIYKVVIMDESISKIAIDISNRGGLYYNIDCKSDNNNTNCFNKDLVVEFLRSLTYNSGYTLNLECKGKNQHHLIESIFKALGLCIRGIFKLKKMKKSSTKERN
ncbi:imidazoleglycerol-phosphate dehydratase HisB [Candidatus Vidania fulgoroideorum]